MSEFGQYFEKYLNLRRVAQINESTLNREIIGMDLLINFLRAEGFEGNELEVTHQDALKFSQYINEKKTLKNNSKLHHLQMCRYFFKEAVKQGWIAKDPWKRIPLPKQEVIIPITLSVKQMKTLLEVPTLETVQGIRDRLIMELLYSCALRKSELVNLRTDSFGADFRTVRVKGKGNKEAVLPVGKMAAHFTHFYLTALYPHLKNKGTDYLFCALKTGKPLDARMLERIVSLYGQEIGLKERLKPHTFRYSIATHLSEEGADIRMIQCYLRHDSIDTTAKYIRHNFKRLQEVHRQTHPREH